MITILHLRRRFWLIAFVFYFQPHCASAQSIFLDLFYPNDSPFFAPSGTAVTTSTYFFHSTGGTVNFKVSDSSMTVTEGVSYYYSSISATVIPLTIIVHLAKVGCYQLSVQADEDTSFINSFPINGYAFDPQRIGAFHQDTSILNFGQVPIGRDTELQEIFAADTIGNISLIPHHVLSPFTSDSFGSPPDNTDLCDSLSLGIWFDFKPTLSGDYSDTVYIYNPVSFDSTMLILKGEGVSSGVGKTDINSSLLHVSPNPCDRKCSMSLDTSPIDRVLIVDALGKQIMDFSEDLGQSISLNTADLPDGIYFVKVSSGSTVFHAQIAVIH